MTSEKMMKFWLNCDAIYKFHKNYQPLMEHKRCANEFMDNLLKDFEHDYQKNIPFNDIRRPYVETFYKIRETMSYEEFREEVTVFLFAGFDTTGKAIPSVLLLLAMNQVVQDKLVEEINKIFPPECDEVDDESLLRMEFLDQVIKESLRLLPVALMFARVVTKDLKLSKL